MAKLNKNSPEFIEIMDYTPKKLMVRLAIFTSFIVLIIYLLFSSASINDSEIYIISREDIQYVSDNLTAVQISFHGDCNIKINNEIYIYYGSNKLKGIVSSCNIDKNKPYMVQLLIKSNNNNNSIYLNRDSLSVEVITKKMSLLNKIKF